MSATGLLFSAYVQAPRVRHPLCYLVACDAFLILARSWFSIEVELRPMAIDALVKPFLLLPLFQGLKPLQLTEIVRRADRIIYRPGDILIEEDQVG